MQQRTIRVSRWVRVGCQHATPINRHLHREPALTTAVTGARGVIAPDVGRQRNVAIGARAHQVGRGPQRVELGRAEGLDNAGARLSSLAPREQSAGLATARLIGVVAPPQQALAAGLEHLGGTARCAEADVHRQLARRDVRVHAVKHAAAGFVLIEAEVQQTPQIVARLGVALRDGVTNDRAQRIAGGSVS